jgi:hypothetical protein
LNFNLTPGAGPMQASVPTGFSFNPGTAQVAPTSTAALADSATDIQAVRDNAREFTPRTVAIVSAQDKAISPTRGNNGVGNGQDPAPPGNPPPNDGPGTGPGSPGRGH